MPPDFSSEVFVGRRLDQISIAEFTIFIVFDTELSVSVQSSLSYTPPEGGGATLVAVPKVTDGILSLVGKDVTAAKLLPDHSLQLSFANGATLLVVADDSGYESYTITIGARLIVV